MALNQLGLGFLFTATDLASGVMARVRSGFTRTQQEVGKFGDRSQDAFKQFAIGAGMMTAGLGGLAVFGMASAKASEFGHQVARIRTVIDEASLSTQAARDATMGLASTYGISALQQADGLYETISAGITDAKEATELLAVANQFAVGGTTDLKGSVDVLTSAVNTYRDQGIDAAQASDLMFTAIAAGKTTASELAQSLGEVAPTAHAAGVSFSELQASIAALTVQGVKTPQAVTGLNAMMSNLMKPTSDAATEAKRLGIEFSATALKTMGLKGVLAQLAGNTKVNDSTFVNLFGSIDGAKAAFVLTANEGAKFNEVLAQMENSSGATKKAFEIMSSTAKFQGDRFMALKENTLILIGEGLEPLKASVYKTVNGWLEAFGKLPKPTRDMLVKVAALASAALTLVGVIIMAKAAFGLAAMALAPFVVAVGGIGAVFLPVVAVVGAVVAAIFGFKHAFEQNVGGIGTKFEGIIGGIRTTWEALTQLFTTGQLDAALSAEFIGGKNKGVNFAVEIKIIADRIVNFFSGIATGFRAAIDAAAPAFEAFGEALSSLGISLGPLSNSAAENGAAFADWGAVGKSVGEVLGKVATLVVRAMTVILKLVDVVGSVVTALGGLETVLIVVQTYMAFMAAKAIVGLVTGLGSIAIGAAGAAGSIAGSLVPALGALKGLSIASMLTGAAAAMKGFVSSAALAAGPILAAAAAIGALLLAYDQLRKLSSELGKDGGSDMWKKLKNDVGFTSDEEYQRELGIVQGKEFDFQSHAKDRTAAPPAVPPISSFDAEPMTMMPGVASVAPAGADAAAFADMSQTAAVAAARAAMSSLPPTQINATLQVDAEVLGRLAMKANASEASRSGAATGVDVG